MCSILRVAEPKVTFPPEVPPPPSGPMFSSFPLRFNTAPLTFASSTVP